MSNLNFEHLSADIVAKDYKKENRKLVEKWDRTGLLNRLEDNKSSNMSKSNMARLLENQCAELLRESSTDTNIKGFQNIAFPIVRRVFGGLIANELVSVQPMSLPSGLLFYLDYTYDQAGVAGNQHLDWSAGGSLYGDEVNVGIDGGVPVANLGTGGNYYLNSSYSNLELTQSGVAVVAVAQDLNWVDIDFDFELSGASAAGTIYAVTVNATGSGVVLSTVDETNYKNFAFSGTGAGWASVVGMYKRYNTYNTASGDLVVYVSASSAVLGLSASTVTLSYVGKSGLTVDSAGVVYSPVFESNFVSDIIPEIDIKITAVSVQAETRKLKAKWTPELAQDLNAYHNLDAEVELTQILSEQIALDIDREILNQLLIGATGAKLYWSRRPGQFLNRFTGTVTTGPSFTGTVREWYETLIETIIDAANTIHRKTLRGAANFLVVSPDVATILEASVLYKPTMNVGDPKETQFNIGTEKIGSLNNRFTVYKDPYFPRNKILVGYKGGSFLETGFVYAPYVPLIVTPTIFAPNDFTPRKGVMTRYAKKMVRSDFYAVVIIRDMDVI